MVVIWKGKAASTYLSKDALNSLGEQAEGHRVEPTAGSPYAKQKHEVGNTTESTSGQGLVGMRGLGCH